MAFRKTSSSLVCNPNIKYDQWVEELRRPNEGVSDHTNRVAKTLLRKCNPNQYLLSHSTIVASVDTYEPKNVKLGKQLVRGMEIDVRHPDYRIKPECLNIVNNNMDGWARPLLLATYKTFVGANVYLEHIQIPELSKGFIVDAIARDVGNSVYIDILCATDRKHTKLIDDILSEEITAQSMGCFVPGSLVTLGDGSVLPIEDIRPDMEVLSQKGNVCRVNNLQIRENRWSIYKIKAVGLPVVNATSNHDFYVVPRDSVIYKNNKFVQTTYNFEKLNADKIQINDIIATPIPTNTIKPAVTLEEARLLGYWIGDGWKWENKHDSSIGVGLCCDVSYPDIAKEMSSIIDRISWKSKETRVVANGEFFSRSQFISAWSENDKSFASLCKRAGVSRRTGYNWVNSYKEKGTAFLSDPRKEPKAVSCQQRKNAYYLVSSSHAVRNLIDAYTHGRKALEKSISQDVMSWPIDHQLAFLSGVVDSDGCVSTTKNGTKQVFISTRNRNLANQYFLLLARCGIISTVSSIRRKGTKLLPNASGIDYQIRIRNDGSVKIPSVKIQKNKSEIQYKSGNSDRWIAGGYLFSRIKKIDKTEYRGFVYDMQVDNDHSYVVNGIGVSNCISLFTICTKCGNVAADDSNLCSCILYEGKGNKFIDDTGAENQISELIGHVSVPKSNQFIEASWVKNPAFKGAVKRNLLNPTLVPNSQFAASQQIYDVRSSQPLPDGIKHAASMKIAQEPEEKPAEDKPADEAPTEFDKADKPADEKADEKPEKEESKEVPVDEKIDKLIDSIQETIVEALSNRIKERFGPKPEDVGYAESPTQPVGVTGYNDNLVLGSTADHKYLKFKNGLRKQFGSNKKLIEWSEKNYKIVHYGGLRAIKANHLHSRDLVLLSWVEDRIRLGHDNSTLSSLYKVVLAVGPMKLYPSQQSYLAACSIKLGRKLTPNEERFFIWKGKISSLAIGN